MSATELTAGPKVDPSTVPGWGVDADQRNNPTYPYRNLAGDQSKGMDWIRPPQQTPDVEVLQSIEYDHLPAVVGTSVPPSGLSGMIRRAAFRRSESDWLHWLMLLGADRVNMVEGMLDDLGQGRIPNLLAERGIAAEWEHDKKGVMTKAAVIAGLSVLGVALLRRRSRRGRR